MEKKTITRYQMKIKGTNKKFYADECYYNTEYREGTGYYWRLYHERHKFYGDWHGPFRRLVEASVNAKFNLYGIVTPWNSLALLEL